MATFLQKADTAEELYLAAQFERVDFFSLLAQSLIHTAQVVTHHAELVFVAPLCRSQLILHVRHRSYNVHIL